MKPKLWLALLSALMAAASCDTGVTPVAGQNDANSLPPSCIEAADHSDLEWLQREVFTPSCAAFSSCHTGLARSAGGLNLEAGNTLANTLNVPSGLFPDLSFVVAGRPDESYLLIIMGGADGPINDEVGTMPLRNPTLCSPKLEATRRWISGLDNTPDAGVPDAGASDAGPSDAGPTDAGPIDASP